MDDQRREEREDDREASSGIRQSRPVRRRRKKRTGTPSGEFPLWQPRSSAAKKAAKPGLKKARAAIDQAATIDYLALPPMEDSNEERSGEGSSGDGPNG